jgi:hypothetical protein
VKELEKYDVGEVKIFETYDFTKFPPTANNRKWLKKVKRKEIDYRVGFLTDAKLINNVYEVEVISSYEEFNRSIKKIDDL